MSKEVQVIAWCDGPTHDDENPPRATEEYIIMVGGVTAPTTVDLCNACAVTILNPLFTLLDRGAPAQLEEKPKRKRRRVAPPAEGEPQESCPLCDYVWRIPLSVRQT